MNIICRFGALVFALFLVASPVNTWAAPVPCGASDLQTAKRAQSDAGDTLSSVINFVRGNDDRTKALILKWFGNNDATTVAKITGVFNRSKQWLTTVNFYCLYENDGSYLKDVHTDAGVVRVDFAGALFAYVYGNELGKVYLGLGFFKAPSTTGYDSKLGTLVHEITHFWLTGSTNSRFKDIYNKADCLSLAKSSPAKAQSNAQNYEYFVEEWLKQK